MITDIIPEGIELSDAELEAASGGDWVAIGTYDSRTRECRVDGMREVPDKTYDIPNARWI